MKKILIVSATRKTNYILAKKLEEILLTLDIEVTVISLEDYELPLYIKIKKINILIQLKV